MGYREKIRTQHRKLENRNERLLEISIATQEAFKFWNKAAASNTARIYKAKVAYLRLQEGNASFREWLGTCPFRWVRKLARYRAKPLICDEFAVYLKREYDKSQIEKILGGMSNKGTAAIAITLGLSESYVTELMMELVKEFSVQAKPAEQGIIHRGGK